MAESLIIDKSLSKAEQYDQVIAQIEALVATESNQMANLANVAAVLKEAFGFFWVGFYLVDSPDELVLGPFQGPLACTRIRKGKGVCGASWADKKSILVPDVDAFPGHIACSSLSKSEVVIPGFSGDEVRIILDVDSDNLNDFDGTDQEKLEKLMQVLASQGVW
ncbi:MAG: GAF domain-containing protein [Cyclobacteriaceae bacterium]|nr:GAF domain-containing protein [Cyclobacteriaceae bacterium]MCH8517267.1 GAF domain-containing protein [Cyclobacteriaceae bacterium]